MHLNIHRKEMNEIMVNYFKFLQFGRDELCQRVFVQALLLFNIPDEQIKDALIKEFKFLSVEEAEAIIQFVREHPDDKDW